MSLGFIILYTHGWSGDFGHPSKTNRPKLSKNVAEKAVPKLFFSYFHDKRVELSVKLF